MGRPLSNKPFANDPSWHMNDDGSSQLLPRAEKGLTYLSQRLRTN
jgi:hypothetical protein